MADRMTEGERYVRDDVPVSRTEPRSNGSMMILIAVLAVVGLAVIIWAFASTSDNVPTSQTTIEAPSAPTTTLPNENGLQPLNNEAAPESAPAVTEPVPPEPTAPAPVPAQ
jgi:flagellar basal body-associated protein FliL